MSNERTVATTFGDLIEGLISEVGLGEYAAEYTRDPFEDDDAFAAVGSVVPPRNQPQEQP